MSRARVLAVSLLLTVVPSCGALDNLVRVTDPSTGGVIETTVGDLAADAVENVGGAVGAVVGDVVGVATGNPVLGAGVAAALLALLGAGAARLRRRRQ
tara:strand:+ start:2291 stop:2584 length:294 start_codon:yes stop_codon:yes gene_type:complete